MIAVVVFTGTLKCFVDLAHEAQAAPAPGFASISVEPRYALSRWLPAESFMPPMVFCTLPRTPDI